MRNRLVLSALLTTLLAAVAVLGAGAASGASGATAVALKACGPVQYEGAGAPSALIVSDLPLDGDSRQRSLQMNTAIELVLKGAGWKAGSTTVGFQACDDSSPKTGLWTKAICQANAKAYAADPGVLARDRHLQLGLRRSRDPDPRQGSRRRRGDGLPRQHRDLPDRVEPRMHRRHPGQPLSEGPQLRPRRAQRRLPGSGPGELRQVRRGEAAPTSSTPAATRPASARRTPSAAPRRSPGSRWSASPPGTRRRRATRR